MTKESRQGWIELSVTADSESVEPVSELFSQYGYNSGVVIQEAYVQDPDGDNLTVDSTKPVTVTTYVPSDSSPDVIRKVDEGLWHLRQIGTVGELQQIDRPEEDWANAWKEHFQVMRIGERFVIRPSWREYTPEPNDVVIDLDPGMAFGTGHHPTTELCLLALPDLPVGGARIVDAGAGSGILSIAAAKLGAASIDAVEIDSVAARALNENVQLNGVADVVSVYDADLVDTSFPETSYDIVIANIISSILLRLREPLVRLVKPGGILLLSGVIERHESDVVEQFSASGLTLEAREQRGDWISLRYRAAG